MKIQVALIWLASLASTAEVFNHETNERESIRIYKSPQTIGIDKSIQTSSSTSLEPLTSIDSTLLLKLQLRKPVLTLNVRIYS